MNSPDLEHFHAGRFGKSFEFIRFKHVSTGNWPVVSEVAYVWTIGILAIFTLIIGILRIVLRRKLNGRLDLDDGLFAFALCCSAISAIFNVFCASYFYLEAELNIGSVIFGKFDDIVPAVVQYLQILNSVSAVEWIAIYSVKVSYLIFFNKLTSRLRGLRIWWWFVVCFTIPCMIVSCLIGLYLCHDFGPDILLQCTIPDMNMRGGTWNRVSGALDIATDLMIISIPIILISKVKIDLRRKLIIGTILSLSAAMIATALIRLFPPTIQILTIDGPWYFFWVAFESSIAILMVSITSFKSIYGGNKRSNTPSNPAANSNSNNNNPLSRIKNSLSVANVRMSRFFLWTHRSNSEMTADFEELSPISTSKRVRDGRYFAWETPKENRSVVDDAEKGFGYHAGVVPQIRVQERIDVEFSRRSRADLVSLPSKSFSPMSTVNPVVSPSSTRIDGQSGRGSWNGMGRY